MIFKRPTLLKEVFALVWASIVLLFYLFYHLDYFEAIRYFQYYDMLGILSLLGGGIFFGIRKTKLTIGKFSLLNGMGITLLSSLLIILFFILQYSKTVFPNNLSIGMVFSFLGNALLISLGVVAILTVLYTLGNVFLEKCFSLSITSFDHKIISIAVGLVLLTLVLFFLGAGVLLQNYIVIPILLAIVAIFWKTSLGFLKGLFITPITFKQPLKWWGVFSFVLLTFWVIINFLQINRPIPFGYDALVLYMKLPTLIQDYQGLVQGNQPYNWSLFMSLGYVVFNKIEFVLALSFVGGVLSLFALYAIIKRWLGINESLVCLLLFYATPTINFQSYKDMKIDLGLLFIALTIVLLLIQLLYYKPTAITVKAADSTGKKLFSDQTAYLVLIGLLSGFAIGIKLTALFIIFSLLMSIWYKYTDLKGLIGLFFLILFAVFLIRLDDFSGLRQYHLGTNTLQWASLIIGISLIGRCFLKDKVAVGKAVKDSLIYLAFTGLIFLPWPIKNYSETKSLSINGLIYGKPTNPGINFNVLQQKWQEEYGK